MTEWLAPLLIGEDPDATERHWQRMYNALRDHGRKGVVTEAISAIDTALWDIRGKRAGMPVMELIGVHSRKLCCYATGGYGPNERFMKTDGSLGRALERRGREQAGQSVVELLGRAHAACGEQAREQRVEIGARLVLAAAKNGAVVPDNQPPL